ncbi:hypothetical protein PGT21_033631 [Puccinia graminis f. sp. tritici]|uniref:Uncharacterized protein n=1 Tax=Puccinia graminis f. sp. tritici TaxID=56615 RepID=A0A5B0MFD2_PUCGR|nr:hypothetical protein PGT21_033631 [Puccinia graminis f. sp. tritici]
MVEKQSKNAARVGAVTAHETPNETPRCRSARERHAIVRGASGKVTFRAGASPNCPYTTGAPRRQTVEGSDGQTDLPRPGQTFLSADELMASAGQLSGLSTRAVKPGLQRLTGAAGAPVVQPTEWVEQPLSRDYRLSAFSRHDCPVGLGCMNLRRAGRGVILTMLPTTVRRGGQPNCGSTDKYTAARG